jgi:hypothetical protein
MDNMVARETAFLVLTVLSLTVAKVDSIGLLIRKLDISVVGYIRQQMY